MRTMTNQARFGTKGQNANALSYAEMLLSGQPLQRVTEKTVQSLKPRPKARFGTKGCASERHRNEANLQDNNKGWKVWRSRLLSL